MDEDRTLSALSRLEASVTEPKAGQMRIEATQLELRVTMMDRVEPVEDKLTNMQNDVTVVPAAALRSVRRQDAERDDEKDLNRMVSGMYVVLMRLKTDVEELQKKAS